MQVLRPTSFVEALVMKAAHRDAIPMAGGTDLLVGWPEHLDLHDRTFLDLGGLDELRILELDDERLVLGALVTYWDVERAQDVVAAFPLLRDAARQVGAVQIQTRGTWAGNIANASPAADGVPVLMAYGAVVVIASERGEREVPLERFYRGYKDMDLEDDELIHRIIVPRTPVAFARFAKVGSRRAQAITKVGAAVVRRADGWRVVANSVAPTVRRCPAIEARLEAAPPVTRPDDLLDAIDADVTPIDDLRSTAAYRRTVLSRVLFDLVASH